MKEHFYLVVHAFTHYHVESSRSVAAQFLPIEQYSIIFLINCLLIFYIYFIILYEFCHYRLCLFLFVCNSVGYLMNTE